MQVIIKGLGRCLVWILFFCIGFFTGGQESQAQQIEPPTFLGPLENYSSLLPEEKVYLHLDKTHYVPGDTIWFAAYVTAGALNVPSPLSKVLYVDFLSNEGQLLEQKKVKIDQGAGKGEFRTQRFQSEGHYHIRAYTQWMKGFEKYPDFQQRIQILEPYNLSFQVEPTITWEAAGTNFQYTVDFKARNERNAPLASESLRFEVVGRGEPATQGLTGTTSAGEGTFRFALSEQQLREAPELRLFLDENEEFSIQRSFKLPLPDALVRVRFFPEGGNWIAGMPAKMGIQAMLPDGSGKALKGEVVLAEASYAFETNALGLGSITFPALAPEDLTGAGIRFSGLDGPPPAATLPPLRTAGISLSVTNFNNQLLNISAHNSSPSLEAQALYLLVHNRGAIGHLERVSFQDGGLNSRVRTEGLPYGINQVTLLTEEGTPLAERLVYIHNRTTPELQLQPDRLDFAPRAKNTFLLALPSTADFQDARFSVAITDALESGDAAHQSLASYLYLSADLDDFHLPATELLRQYAHEDMEEIMLTHGWRRFDWEHLMQEKYQNSTFIEEGINLIGQVSPGKGIRGKLRGGSISVFVDGEEEAFLAGDYGPNGNFLFDALEFYDTTQVTISVKDGRLGTLVDLNLEESPNTYAYWEEFTPFRGDFTLSEALLEALAQARKRKESALAFDESSLMEMEEFVVEADKYDAVEEGIDRMYGQGDVTLRTADIPGSEAFLDIWQLIQGRVPGVRVTYNIGGQPSIVIRGSASFGDEAPIVLLDNMPVDYMTAGMIPPRDVSAIDIFKDGASLSIFGASGGGGVIAIYTKRGLGDPSALGEGMFLLQFPGYARAATFYQPPYERGPLAKPDYRGTLYWNPDLRLDGDGRATLPFFNSDVAKTYRVVLQGLDAAGQALYQEWVLGPQGLLPVGEN